MKTISFIVIILSIIYISNVNSQGIATPPAPCYISPSFSTSMSQLILDENEAIITNTGIIYISTTEKRVRFDVLAGSTTIGGSKEEYVVSIFEDFNSGDYFLYDPQSNSCSSYPLNFPMGTGQIPSDSSYLGEIFIGGQGIRQYGFEVFNSSYYFAVGLTSGSCFLSNVEIYNGTSTNEAPKLLVVESFWNFVPYVSPYTFEAPCACQNLVSFEHFKPQYRKKILSALKGLELRHSAF